ncbi:MAG: outer membrane lipoprotein-sorting protein [Candidatus Electryonea clarkiae]|nr:outer membrane lipoprotein-sorting protein [Candidatus Electryonea clarkiae]MDP8287087.1 outer membrane lipoprotein-sorting protein [Candidatus Electryonea clarkiae]
MCIYDSYQRFAGFVLVLILMFVLSTFPVLGIENPVELLKKIDAAENIPHSFSIVKQTITTSGGSERTMTMKAWSAENGELSLMVYTDPRRVAGDKILQRDSGDNIWYYMNRRDVTRHFTGSSRKQSAMGSDFSYEDLSQGDLVEDYNAEIVGEENIDGTPCIKLKCTPTESGPSYQFIYLWVGNNDYLTRKIEYYDEDGHLKTLYLSEFQTIEGRLTPMKMEMVSKRESSRTLMENVSISFKEEPDASLFTKEALTREMR